MMLLARCRQRLARIAARMGRTRCGCLRARPAAAHAAGTGADLLRSRAQLLAEHAPLRQQALVPRRSVGRPAVTPTGRALLVLLAGRIRAWRQALLIVQPDTLLRRHRAGFRTLWRWKSRPGPGRPPLPAGTVASIRRMAGENPRRGAERIRAAKRPVQTSLPVPRAPGSRGQPWATS